MLAKRPFISLLTAAKLPKRAVIRPLAQTAVAKEEKLEPYEYIPENHANLASSWPAKSCEFQNITVVKDGESPRGPQKEYPDLKYHLPYDTSKYRLGMIPESYFTFLHERTGVLGPYILLWGGAITLISKEFLIFQEEAGAILAFMLVPPFLARFAGPAIDKYTRVTYNDEMMVLDKLKESKIQQYSNEADALDEDATRADAGKEIFSAYSANAENMVEAEFRQRQEQVHEAFKRRLDYQVAMQSLEEQVVQKQMVSWVKQEVHKAIDARSQKEGIAQCLKDLKALAATNVSI
ncbi:ATP synthase peripheral stalk subunit b, mitochondrial-like [Convolutriloba macropyga]|uniref:ATP synthase peripheral stalk subunit b, mitochondrial-like n=1 Tax=Convolutriloba macropyga TaxID=536237 RepID=UPI003F51D473